MAIKKQKKILYIPKKKVLPFSYNIPIQTPVEFKPRTKNIEYLVSEYSTSVKIQAQA